MKFSTAVVATITTGILMCDIREVYKLLNHMSDQSVYTHQIPMFMRYYRPKLEALHPRLVPEVGFNVKETQYEHLLAYMVERVGPELEVPAMPIAPVTPFAGLVAGKVAFVVRTL